MQNFLANNEWARDPRFNHFWNHYAICQKWKQQHNDARRQLFLEQFPVADEVSEDSNVTERLSRCEIRDEEVENPVEMEENEENEVMSEEMREFFAKTQEHRRQLAAKRAAEQAEKPWIQANREEYVNVEKISVRGRVEATAEHRNANAEFIEKRENARKMYGESAASRILALESQLEMRFEEEYARNPQMWPNIPFRF